MDFTGDQNAEARLNEIAYLLQSGQKIQAIKVYRGVTGASLADAKAAIERMELSGTLGNVSTQPASVASVDIQDIVLAEIARLLTQNKKIQAIKLFREQTGANLTEAKNAVERMELSGTLGNITAQPEIVQLASATTADAQEMLLAEIARLLTQNMKIQAIKLFREQTGANLAEAKNAVERFEQQMRSQGF